MTGLLPTDTTEATNALAMWVIEREQMNEGRRLLRDSLSAERRAIVERIRGGVEVSPLDRASKRAVMTILALVDAR